MTSAQNILIGWLDYSEESQRNARVLLSALKSSETLDELGFGILRDAFADVFFPATNTIMTRTRYLFFVPGLYLMMERDRVPSSEARKHITALENRLRKLLMASENAFKQNTDERKPQPLRDYWGIIGREAKEALRRYPSSIYWSALRTLGILCPDLRFSQGYYHAQLDRFYVRGKPVKDDDGLLHLAGLESRNWDRDLNSILADGKSWVTKDFKLPTSLDLELTTHEARYLKERYNWLSEQRGRPSLLSHLLNRIKPFDNLNFPWDVPLCPDKLSESVEHARLLSMLVRGATLQYWHMLLEARRRKDIDALSYDMSKPLVQWWEQARDDLNRWNVDEFIHLADTSLQALRGNNDRNFFRQWLARCLSARTGQQLLIDEQAQQLIYDRERAKRPIKGRLRHDEYLRRWTPPETAYLDSLCDPDTFPYHLDYRTGVGRRFFEETVTALKKGN